MPWHHSHLILLPAILSLLLCGCAVTGSTQGSPAIAALQEQARATPDNSNVQLQLLQVLLENYSSRKSKASHDEALLQARKCLGMMPGHHGLQQVVYQLLVDQAIFERDTGVLPELRTLFAGNPGLQQTTLLPPSAVEALQLLSNAKPGDSKNAVKSLLRKALGEKPSDIGSRRLLAGIYKDERHPELAIAMLEQATDLAPDNAAVQMDLGDLYLERARSGSCSVEQTDDIKHAAKAYKTAIAASSENPRSHRALARAYELLGLGDLTLFEVQEYARLQPGPPARVLVADTLLQTDRADEAIRDYLSITGNDARNVDATLGLARSYFMTGKWQQAIESWGRYKSIDNEPYFYGLLMESLATYKLHGRERARSILAFGISRERLSPWEAKIYDFETGALAAEELLNSAGNTCQKTEAEYYVGFRYFLEDDITTARLHWQRTVDLGAFAFNEYAAARYALAQFQPAGTPQQPQNSTSTPASASLRR